MRDALTATWTLVRFDLRRSRFGLCWWLLGITGLYAVQALALRATYPTQADLDQLAASLQGNAAVVAMAGPPLALDTIGGQTAWQCSAFGAILAGLMSTFLVVRHTRGGEESGTDEPIRAGVVGRYATGAAALIVTTAANLVLVVTIALSLLACGLPAVGSWTLGAACGLTGLVFMGFAFVACELASTTRGAWGASGAFIGVAYALRAVGDVNGSAVRWLSPIAWGQQMRAYADERWWPALLLVASSAVLVAVGAVLHAHRDFGDGVLPSRSGRATRAWRGGALELAWRLDRPAIVGWVLGLVFFGLAYGTIGDDIAGLLGDSGDFGGAITGGQSGGAALIDGFYGSAVLLLSIVASAFGVSLVLHARTEEAAGRAESLLSTPLSRRAFLGSHVVVACVAALGGAVAGAAATGVMYGAVTGSWDLVLPLAGAALAYGPAIAVMIAVAVALVGVVPRVASLGWLGIVVAAVVMLFGPLLRLPGWLTGLSPFDHLALVPLQPVAWWPVLGVTAVAVAPGAVGFWAFRRRDVMN